MTHTLWDYGDYILESRPSGSFRFYSGEAANVMRLVLRYAGRDV